MGAEGIEPVSPPALEAGCSAIELRPRCSHKLEPLRDVSGCISRDRTYAERDNTIIGTIRINPEMARNTVINCPSTGSMKHRFVASGEHDHIAVTVFQMLLLGVQRR